jgi:hypothetical protein
MGNAPVQQQQHDQAPDLPDQQQESVSFDQLGSTARYLRARPHGLFRLLSIWLLVACLPLFYQEVSTYMTR